MAHPLDGVRAKLNRATKHLRELDAKVRAFLMPEPYAIETEPSVHPAYVGWYQGWFRILRDPPLELGVIAGEVLGQYRSALDHLMTQLTILNGTRYGHFPIYPKGRFWLPNKKGMIPKGRVADLVRPEHLAIIERLQEPEVPKPHLRTEVMRSSEALLITQWVANDDKHEIVRPGLMSPRKVGVSYGWNIAEFEWVWQPFEDLGHNTELYRVKFVPQQSMEVPYRLQPDLTFGEEPYRWLPVSTIRVIGRRVRRIVQRFVRVTPEFRDDANPN